MIIVYCRKDRSCVRAVAFSSSCSSNTNSIRSNQLISRLDPVFTARRLDNLQLLVGHPVLKHQLELPSCMCEGLGILCCHFNGWSSVDAAAVSKSFSSAQIIALLGNTTAGTSCCAVVRNCPFSLRRVPPESSSSQPRVVFVASQHLQCVARPSVRAVIPSPAAEIRRAVVFLTREVAVVRRIQERVIDVVGRAASATQSHDQVDGAVGSNAAVVDEAVQGVKLFSAEYKPLLILRYTFHACYGFHKILHEEVRGYFQVECPSCKRLHVYVERRGGVGRGGW